MGERLQPHSAIPRNIKGSALLVGNIFCAHCGNRLTLTTSGGRPQRNEAGEMVRTMRPRYQCHYKVRHPGECSGQSGYDVNKLDRIIDEIIVRKFQEVTAASEAEILSAQHEKELELARIRVETVKESLQKKQKDLEDFKAETLKVIRGTSKLSIDLLNSLVAETEGQVRQIEAQLADAEHQYSDMIQSSENLRSEYDQLLTWADLYKKSSFEAKKMIVSQFIKAVYVGRDYDIDIEFNVSFDDFRHFSSNIEEIRDAPMRFASA